jgi:hypothetical protein
LIAAAFIPAAVRASTWLLCGTSEIEAEWSFSYLP